MDLRRIHIHAEVTTGTFFTASLISYELMKSRTDRVLENSLLLRLLKKVQMQGGVTHQMGTRYPSAGWVQVRGVLGPYVAAPRERGGTHRRWVSADGPFSAAC